VPLVQGINVVINARVAWQTIVNVRCCVLQEELFNGSTQINRIFQKNVPNTVKSPSFHGILPKCVGFPTVLARVDCI